MKDLIFILVMCLFIGGCFIFILWNSDQRVKHAMEKNYCFEEKADSSLYHYVCEE